LGVRVPLLSLPTAIREGDWRVSEFVENESFKMHEEYRSTKAEVIRSDLHEKHLN
jgi:hypothetical protein